MSDVNRAGEPPRSPVGNMAAMREAVHAVYNSLCDHEIIYPKERWRLIEIFDAALSAPPRNCDVYDNESCRMAYHLHGDGIMTMQAFADWLFAPATEKKGD